MINNKILKKGMLFLLIFYIIFSIFSINVYAIANKNSLDLVRSHVRNGDGSHASTFTDTRFDSIEGFNTIKGETDAYYSFVKTNIQNSNKNNRLNKALDGFNENAQYVYGFLMAFGSLTSLLMFIIIFVRITWLPEHAFQKRKAMEDMVTSGVATVLLGGAWLIISLFHSIFDRFWESGLVYSKNWKVAGGVFLVEYKQLIVGFLGLATLTALLMLIKSFITLILSGTNPQQRAAKMSNIIWCGLATAGLGALTIFTGIFWGVLRV